MWFLICFVLCACVCACCVSAKINIWRLQCQGPQCLPTLTHLGVQHTTDTPLMKAFLAKPAEKHTFLPAWFILCLWMCVRACEKFLCKQQREHIRDVFVTVSGMALLPPAVCPTGLLVSLELLCVKAGGLRLTACTTQLFLRSTLQMLQTPVDLWCRGDV